jgi:hypothetical protein
MDSGAGAVTARNFLGQCREARGESRMAQIRPLQEIA